MSLAEEIQKLQQLRAQGALTEDEFAKAKAQLLAGASAAPPGLPSRANEPKTTPSREFLDFGANLRAGSRLLVLLAILGGGAWFALRMTVGEQSADRVAATIVRSPIDLKDETRSVRASSWEAVGVVLPYSGTLEVSMDVVRGNGLDVYVIAEDQLSAFRARRQFRHIPEFESAGTRTYRRSASLSAGAYYVVLQDQTLGILSASSTDVRFKARLVP